MIFKDKDVALVGSAKYLKNLNLGKEIDAADIVVRINKGASVISEEKSLYFGKRCDVIYHCLLEDAKDSVGAKFGYLEPEKWEKMGVKNVFCLPNSSISGVAQGNLLSNLINMENVKKLNDRIPVGMIDFNFYNSISSKVKCKPNTGLVSIFHILSQQPKKLRIFGFSFLLDGWFKEYREGSDNMPGETRTIEEIENAALYSTRHVQKNQWEYSKDILLNNQSVVLDPVMKKVLEMKNFTKDEFDLIEY